MRRTGDQSILADLPCLEDRGRVVAHALERRNKRGRVARGSWDSGLERPSLGDVVYELTIFIELRRGYFVVSGSTYRRRLLVTSRKNRMPVRHGGALHMVAFTHTPKHTDMSSVASSVFGTAARDGQEVPLFWR